MHGISHAELISASLSVVQVAEKLSTFISLTGGVLFGEGAQ